MEPKTSSLKLHTTMIPEPTTSDPKSTDTARRKRERKWPHRRSKDKTAYRRRVSAAERLLRNTSVACALLLAVLALKNIDTPVTNRITSALNQAIHMDLDLDETLGRLSFVENLMPESALVFFHTDTSARDDTPVSGSVAHEWSVAQPWLEYAADDGAPVYSLRDGTVAAASQSAEGDWTILIHHAGDAQTVYAYLADCNVSLGESVSERQVIGHCGTQDRARLYMEYRVGTEPADPASLTE